MKFSTRAAYKSTFYLILVIVTEEARGPRLPSQGIHTPYCWHRASKLDIDLSIIISCVREDWVSLPGGFTKTGSPLLVFPDKSQFNYLHVTDLHTLLQYYINVVPRSEQVFLIVFADISCKRESDF